MNLVTLDIVKYQILQQKPRLLFGALCFTCCIKLQQMYWYWVLRPAVDLTSMLHIIQYNEPHTLSRNSSHNPKIMPQQIINLWAPEC